MKVSEEIINELKNIAGEDAVKVQEPMSLHTTMEVGGPAACYTVPGSEKAMADTLEYLKTGRIPYYMIGNGSNIIFRDEGFDGVVVSCTGIRGYEIIQEGADEVLISVRAGTSNKDFAQDMIREGLAGFEFASGIPGSVGGATAMNAGAYDGEIRNIVRQVKMIDPAGNIITKTNDEMEFGYRQSLAGKDGYVVLETVFALRKDNPEAIRERVDELSRRRQEKQPLEYPSCGSTFKRPEGYFAGKLISDSGLKGKQIGGARVSDKHAGFIINADHASAADVLALIELVKKTVLERQGVALECEVKII